MPLSVSLPPSTSSSLLLTLLLLILWHGNLSGLILLFVSLLCYLLFFNVVTLLLLCLMEHSFPNTKKGCVQLARGTKTPGIQPHVSEKAYVTCQRQERRHSFRVLQLRWQFYSPNISMSIQLLKKIFSTLIPLHIPGVNVIKTEFSCISSQYRKQIPA